VIKISKADDGGLKAVLYSIDQGAQPLTASAVTLQGSSVKISVVAAGATYEGKLNEDGSSIAGTLNLGTGPLPLNPRRATNETAWAIPDPPARPKAMAADAIPVFEVATSRASLEHPASCLLCEAVSFQRSTRL
jgi:hypothetical protein